MRVKTEEFLKTSHGRQRQRDSDCGKRSWISGERREGGSRRRILIESFLKQLTLSKLGEIEEAVKKKVDLTEWS